MTDTAQGERKLNFYVRCFFCGKYVQFDHKFSDTCGCRGDKAHSVRVKTHPGKVDK